MTEKTVEQLMREKGLNPDDFTLLRCVNAACRKPIVAAPNPSGGEPLLQECWCKTPQPRIQAESLHFVAYASDTIAYARSTFEVRVLKRDDPNRERPN